MKNFCCSILIVLIISGCKKPYEKKDIGDPIYSPEKARVILNGKWTVRKITHIDEKSLTKESIEITDYFLQNPGSQLPSITFNTDNNTYISDTAGVAISYFGSGGKWLFDNDQYPSRIYLLRGAADTVLINIAANLQSREAYLSFRESFSCSGEASMTYNLELIKQ